MSKTTQTGTHAAAAITAWQIRQASAEDVAAIIALFAIADDAAAAGAPHQFRGAWAAPRSEQEVLGLLEHPDVALFVAELEGRVVGQVVARIETVPENTPLVPRRFAKLYDLVVMPEARAQGIGRALLRAAEQWSVARGMASIELTVWELNGAARRLYEQLGYTTDARRLLRVLPVAKS
jgi:ribosomal protein S18 acetylase RimI-like enzyme